MQEAGQMRRNLAIGGGILGNVVDGYGVVAVAFAGKAIERSWDLDPAMLGFVFGAGPAGMMLGSLIISPFADRFGRRAITLLSLLLVTLGMLAAASSQNQVHLIGALMATGLGIGGVLATLNTAVAELAPQERRMTVMAIFSAGYPFGSTLAGGFAIGLMILYGWQIVFVLGAGLAGLAFIVNFFTLIEPERRSGGRTRSGFSELFGTGRRGTTIAISAAFLLNMISFYFILLWTARLASSLGFSDAVGATTMTIVNLGSLAGPLIFGAIADRVGLVRVAKWYFVFFAVAIAAFALNSGALWSLYLSAAAVGLLMAGAMTSLYASTPLLFSADVRASGTGLAIGIGRLGATIGPILAGIGLQQGFGRSGLYIAFAIPPLLVALLFSSGLINPAADIRQKEKQA